MLGVTSINVQIRGKVRKNPERLKKCCVGDAAVKSCRQLWAGGHVRVAMCNSVAAGPVGNVRVAMCNSVAAVWTQIMLYCYSG